MKKKLLSFICMFALGVSISGCQGNEKTAGLENLQALTVEYEYGDGAYRRVKIGFSENKKEIRDYVENGNTERTEELVNEEAILTFLQEKVIPFYADGKSLENQKQADDEPIIWKVYISAEKDEIIDYGLEEEIHPEYWEELVELIEL